MKRLLLTVMVVFALVPAFAQKGTWLWYGNLYGHNSSTDAPVVTGVKWSINTTHGVGYQFSKHWLAGLQGSYGYAKSEVLNTLGRVDDLKNSSWSAGVFARYIVGKRLYGFVQGDLGWAGSKQKINDREVGDSHGFGVGLTPTVGVNVYNGWCLNLSFINISWNSTNPNSVNTTSFNYNFGRDFIFGISKIIGRGVNEGVCSEPQRAPKPTPAGK